MRTEELASKFLKLSVINGVLAFLFTLPILDPALCIATPPGLFGCRATMDINWPGTWVLIAWITFILVGVLGTLFWGASYYFAAKVSNKTVANRTLGWLHIIIFEVGLLGATGLMAAIGYVGGSYLAQGGNSIVAAAVIAQNIIPPLSSDSNNVLSDMPPVVEAAFIGITLLGSLIGFLSYFRLKSQ